MKKISPFFIFLVIVGLAAGLILITGRQELREKAAATGSTLSIQPAQISVNAGDSFAASVSIDTGDDTVSAAEIYLTFDRTKLEFKNIQIGNFLPVKLVPEKIDAGSISLILGCCNPQGGGNQLAGTPKKGTGILATINFKAIAASSFDIILTSDTLVAGIGKSGNTVIKLQSAHVTINNPSSTKCLSDTDCGTGTACKQSVCANGSCRTSIKPNGIVCTEAFGTGNCQNGSCVISPSPTQSLKSCQFKNKGDVNCDGKIDGVDFSMWMLSQCRSSSSQKCNTLVADFNGDGSVDDLDYNIWFLNSK